MKFYVNNRCIGCGKCAGLCPDVFSMTKSGVAKAKDMEVPSGDVSDAKEAMVSCPVDAIEKV